MPEIGSRPHTRAVRESHQEPAHLLLGAVRLGQLRVRHHGHGGVLPGVLPEVLEHRSRLHRNHVSAWVMPTRPPASSIALLAPVLGAIGDRGGRRKQFLMAWTLLGVGATGALYFVGQGEWLPAALLFVLGTMGFNGGIVFNDSLLLDVAKPARSRPRFRLRLFARLSRRRRAVPHQRAHGQQARVVWPRGCVGGGARVLPHRRRLVAGVHDPADARRAGAAARSAPGFRGGDSRRDSANSAPPSRTCASTAPS